MLYFSELEGTPVFTEDGIKIGNLKDLIFLASETPKITKLSIDKTAVKFSQSIKIPIAYVKKINHTIIVQKNYEIHELAENELYVRKNIMDQQIIDIKGNKVVRVNDVVIQDKPTYYIAGVDVGLLGLLRWMRLERMANILLRPFKTRISPQFLSWADIQPLELVRGRIILKQEQEKLEKIRAEDLADHLEKTNIKNASKLLSLLDQELAAEVIDNLNITYQHGLINSLPPARAVEIISRMDPDEAVDILLTLSESKQKTIIDLLPEHAKKDILHLMKYVSTPIGEVMITDYFLANPEDTARNIIDKIRKHTKDYYILNNIYVVNNQQQLIGVVNLHELIMADLDTPLYKYMIQNVIVIHLKTPKDIAVKRMIKYQINSLPVIDDQKQVQGLVVFKDIIEGLIEEGAIKL